MISYEVKQVCIVNLLISIHNLDKETNTTVQLLLYYALIGCYDASQLVKELEIV